VKLGVVVVTHGQLATELVNSAEMIVGDLPHFTAVSIGWHEDVDHAREEIGRAINRVGTIAPGEGERPSVLVLADMFGGTPANLAVTYVNEDVEVITGVNLPMLLKLARPQEGKDLLTLAREMREHGRHAIWVASDLLRGEKSGDKA
jgi:Phosphotransferase system, mannose/fructose-specific component IIA